MTLHHSGKAGRPPTVPQCAWLWGSQQWRRGESPFLIQARSSKGRQQKNRGQEPIRWAGWMNNLHCPKVCGARRLCCNPPLTSNAVIFWCVQVPPTITVPRQGQAHHPPPPQPLTTCSGHGAAGGPGRGRAPESRRKESLFITQRPCRSSLTVTLCVVGFKTHETQDNSAEAPSSKIPLWEKESHPRDADKGRADKGRPSA